MASCSQLFARLVEVAPVEDQLGAETMHGGNLDRVRLLGYADRRLNAEAAGGIGDRLAVVPGRGRDHSALVLLRAELRDQVDPVPDLEGADRLMVLVLDEDLGVGQRVQARVAEQRRWAQMW